MKISLRNPQRGLTLVEIMVAMAISLVLLAGIIQIFLGSKQAYRVQDGLARLQENGRFAMEFMGRSIREASYTDISVNPALKYTLFNGTAITGTDGTPDTITVSFDSTTDCLGEDTATASVPGGNVPRAVNRFFLNNNDLKCQTLNSLTLQTQPLIEGVEDMQILYGVANGDQNANRYVVAPAAGSPDWANVVSARVCLLLRSTEDNLVDQPLNYQDCNGDPKTAPDRRLRRAFTATINLRNRINTSPALWN